jgi:predicted hydrocarbon binding protein
MATAKDLEDRLAMRYEPATYRRRIAGHDVIIHCHHYNARVQRTLEGARGIDGKGLIVRAAESVFADQLARAGRPEDDEAARFALAELLYAHLGFGRIDLAQIAAGVVTASSSHFVEGWLAGLGQSERNVCTFTEGYLQAAVFAATGAAVTVRETECMARGAARCSFVVERGERGPVAPNHKEPAIAAPEERGGPFVHSANVDEQAIIDAVVGIPMVGDAAGLIPAFSVYLANMPADFYNQICISFVEAMRGLGREKAAMRLLISDGEHCGMNTFRGIMHSPEWDGLIAPMVRDRADALLALIAISNALGWGDWHVTAHTPTSLELDSRYGYEAVGFREYRGKATAPQCAMLTGVAAGVMQLVYGEGTVEDRYGTFASSEDRCVACGDPACSFTVERVE